MRLKGVRALVRSLVPPQFQIQVDTARDIRDLKRMVEAIKLSAPVEVSATMPRPIDRSAPVLAAEDSSAQSMITEGRESLPETIVARMDLFRRSVAMSALRDAQGKGLIVKVFIEKIDGYSHTISAIRSVRAITCLGLKEAKDVVDMARGGRPQPTCIFVGVPTDNLITESRALMSFGATLNVENDRPPTAAP